MGPWSFPIVAEARMAERLLEAERARLARAAAAGQRSVRGRRERPQPQVTPSSRRRLLVRASALALAGCLVLGGAVVGQADLPTAARPVVVPVEVLSRTSTVARAVGLLYGEAPGLPIEPLRRAHLRLGLRAGRLAHRRRRCCRLPSSCQSARCHERIAVRLRAALAGADRAGFSRWLGRGPCAQQPALSRRGSRSRACP